MGNQTLRTQDTSVSRQVSTSAVVSLRHLGTNTKM